MDPSQRPLVRKPSTTIRSYLSRSTSTRTRRPFTPSLTLPSNRYTSTGLRSLVTRFRDAEPEFEILTSPRTASSPARTSPAPRISPLTKAFVNALTATKLSNFLVWMLYYDITELPKSAETWYQDISGLDMQGWVALGAHLKKTKASGYGFDLVVLDSICDRLRLDRSVVHNFLIKFADPETMRFSTLARLIHDTITTRKSELETLEMVQAHLHTLNRLTTCLALTLGSSYAVWHAVVQKRIGGFLYRVVGPRIAQRREGIPLVMGTTSERLPREIRDGIQLNYVYEALLQERIVPLWRYGGENESVEKKYATLLSSSSLPGMGFEQTSGQVEELLQENRRLRSQVATLQAEKEDLVQDKRKLASQLATLRSLRDEDENDAQTSRFWSWRTPTSKSPRNSGTPHSSATASPTPYIHARQHSTSITNKYTDVFSSLDSTPLSSSSARLADSLSPPHSSSNVPVRPSAWGMRDVKGEKVRSRRSGKVFDKKSLAYLAQVGEGEDGRKRKTWVEG